MSFNKNESSIIRVERAKLLPIDELIRELQDYDDCVKKNASSGFFRFSDAAFEKAVLERGDDLLNLYLAKIACDQDIFKLLLDQGTKRLNKDKSKEYNSALVLSCLSNSNNEIWRPFLRNKGKEWFDKVEKYLSSEGCYDEKKCLLNNPMLPRKTVAKLLRRDKAFQTLETSLWLSMISVLIDNMPESLFDTDKNNYECPDFDCWDIKKSIPIFLKRAAESIKEDVNAIYITNDFLNKLDHDFFAPLDNYEEIIKEWELLEKLPSENAPNQDIIQEIICAIAVFFGKGSSSIRSKRLSDRCMYYRHGKLSVSQIHSAWKNDGSLFVSAAIRNNTIYYSKNRNVRAKLEEFIFDYNLIRYRRICETIRKRNPDYEFPISPVARASFTEAFTEKENNRIALQQIIPRYYKLMDKIEECKQAIKWSTIFLLCYLIISSIF